MENKEYQDDEFEQFLQDEVKQHRMYPSDHIWKNIRTEIHGYKAWPALTFIALFIITSLTVTTLLINHPNRVFVKNQTQEIKPISATLPITPMPFAKTRSISANNYFEQIAPEQITAETFSDIVLHENKVSQEQTIVPSETIVLHSSLIVPSENILHRLGNTEKDFHNSLIGSTTPDNLLNKVSTQDINSEKEENTNISDVKLTNTESPGINTFHLEPTQPKNELHATADDFLKDFGITEQKKSPKRNSKFGFQLYVTPSTSYRTLSDDKVKEVIQPAATAASSLLQIAPLSVNYSSYSHDVNNVVRHRPAMGLEIGFAVLYNISHKLKLKTGLQLNIRQYSIETFQSRTNDLSTISLINYRGIETISFYSPYNNNTGYKQTQLNNKVYQVSVPIGVQWEMIQGKHFGINWDASLQPTLTLNNNTYLLSADYKHYTGGSDFIRKWNINSSLGLNITYKTGASSWQIGPQIRYQHLPTYSNLYPVKEYLIDYGIRLGYTKQIN